MAFRRRQRRETPTQFGSPNEVRHSCRGRRPARRDDRSPIGRGPPQRRCRGGSCQGRCNVVRGVDTAARSGTTATATAFAERRGRGSRRRRRGLWPRWRAAWARSGGTSRLSYDSLSTTPVHTTPLADRHDVRRHVRGGDGRPWASASRHERRAGSGWRRRGSRSLRRTRLVRRGTRPRRRQVRQGAGTDKPLHRRQRRLRR